MSRPLLPLLCLLVLTACATHASSEDAQMSNALCDQAKSLLATGKTDAARDIYISATNRDASNARAWNGLGVTNDILGKRDDAKTAYQQAMHLSPGDLSTINNMAHLDLENGDYDDAIALLEPHIHEAKASPAMRQNLAEAYAVKGREEEAAALLRMDLPRTQVAQRLLDYNKLAKDQESYADLGSYPTEGMANAHIEETKQIAGSSADAWHFAVVPDVKITGGTPVFTIQVTGEAPDSVCVELNAQAWPCVAHGK